jgi:hypothetical protein
MIRLDPATHGRQLEKRLGRLDGQAALAAFSRLLSRHSALLLIGLIVALVGLRIAGLVGVPVPAPSRRTAALVILGLMVLVALAAATAAYVLRPGREGAAREVDRALSLDDRVTAAWCCLRAGRDDDVARALVYRAGERVRRIEPSGVYPAKPLRFTWFIVLGVIVAVLLLGIGSTQGKIPIGAGQAEVGPPVGEPEVIVIPDPDPSPDADDPIPESIPDPDPEVDPDPEPEPGGEPEPEPDPVPEPPREIIVELYPELPSYPSEGPVPMTARVRARTADERPVAGDLHVRVDEGEWVSLPGTITVPGGRPFDRLRGFCLRQAMLEATGLSSGSHTVQVAYRRDDGGEPVASEPVEIFVEPSPGESDGGGRENPQNPEPEGQPETPPLDIQPPTVIVEPLFNEGETVEKTGPALVFDPSAPRGEPAPERSLEEAFPEIRRRAENAIARDEVPPRWRELVRAYFELIRPR